MDPVDPLTVGELVKLYLYELPEPLIPFKLFSSLSDYLFANSTFSVLYNVNLLEGANLPALKQILYQIPAANLAMINFLLTFLRFWGQESHVAIKRTISIFGCFFLRDGDTTSPKDDVIEGIMDQLFQNQKEVNLLVDHRFHIIKFFTSDAPILPPLQKQPLPPVTLTTTMIALSVTDRMVL